MEKNELIKALQAAYLMHLARPGARRLWWLEKVMDWIRERVG